MTIRRLVPLGALVGALALSACGDKEITANTSCKDYMSQPADKRHDAAMRISGTYNNLMEGGNPLWGPQTDSVCARYPAMTLGEYYGRLR
jgi:hypothetical protein